MNLPISLYSKTNSCYKKIFTIILLCLCGISIFRNEGYTLSYYLLDGESPFIAGNKTLQTGLLSGYERGYIPDWYVRPSMAFGIFSWLQFGGNASYVSFEDQKEKRFSEYEIIMKARIAEFERLDAGFYGYLKFRHSPGSLVYTRYHGDISGVVVMVSPHADAGMDFTGGLCGRISFPFMKNRGVIMYSAEYTLTEFRDYYLETKDYTRRMFFTVTPAIALSKLDNKIIKKNSLSIGIQNRYTYWYARGYSYAAMPQVNWGITESTAVTAGVSLPVIGGGRDYRFLTELNTNFDVGYQFGGMLRARLDVNPVLFSPDGDEVNDILFIRPRVESRKVIKKWEIIIYDQAGKPFKTFAGTRVPPREIRWDGRSNNGRLVTARHNYRIALTVTDINNKTVEDAKSIRINRLIQ